MHKCIFMCKCIFYVVEADISLKLLELTVTNNVIVREFATDVSVEFNLVHLEKMNITAENKFKIYVFASNISIIDEVDWTVYDLLHDSIISTTVLMKEGN